MATLRIHALENASRANGPGLRAVIWVQGCTLGCPGCFNPDTHDPGGGVVRETSQLADDLLRLGGGIEGVSVSGGEPLQQPEALLDLLVRLDGSGLSRLVFSGYTRREIEQQPLGPAILAHLDVLVAGRYVIARREGRGLIGSANQRIHLITSRHTPAEFTRIPAAELIVHADGSITCSGVDPLRPDRKEPLPGRRGS